MGYLHGLNKETGMVGVKVKNPVRAVGVTIASLSWESASDLGFTACPQRLQSGRQS